MWRKKMLIEKINEIIRKNLKRNGWGLYFKGRPLLEMPVNGEPNIYKINDVRINELEVAISEELKSLFEGTYKEGETECQDKGNADSEEM